MVEKIPEKTCIVCSKKFSLHENPSGLVFENEKFICEDCCKKHQDKDISEITNTIMHDSSNGMPIALWLIHEENKDKTMMTTKRKLF